MTMVATSPEPERGADGFNNGLALAEVTAVDDPDGLGRVQLRLSWDPEGITTHWARTANFMGGNGRGAYFVPEIGDEVLVGFEHGDPSHPYVLGALWSTSNPPPIARSDTENNERLIKTRSGHLLRFSDDEQAPEAELSLDDGKQLKLDKDTIVLTDGSGSNLLKIDTNAGTIEITAQNRIELSANQISLNANSAIEVSTPGTLTLKGSTQVNINPPG
jgi:uncharacterized protein involved in type VI secretion and phage assembly